MNQCLKKCKFSIIKINLLLSNFDLIVLTKRRISFNRLNSDRCCQVSADSDLRLIKRETFARLFLQAPGRTSGRLTAVQPAPIILQNNTEVPDARLFDSQAEEGYKSPRTINLLGAWNNHQVKKKKKV